MDESGKKKPSHDEGDFTRRLLHSTSPEIVTALLDIGRKLLGMENALISLMAYIDAPRKCKDAQGNELKVGDVLIIEEPELGHRHEKVVKEVGFKWVRLSKEDYPDKDDGIWYEQIIVKQGWHI